MLEESDSFDNFGSINYKLAISLLVAWVIVYVALLKGVQSLGKVRALNEIIFFPAYLFIIYTTAVLCIYCNCSIIISFSTKKTTLL